MEVKLLAEDDAELYSQFRTEMWPHYSVAGSWENVRQKYSHNPLAQLCPGSGMYALIQRGKIGGVMGAYPMPVTLNETVHPGHMLVDWAVTPRMQRGPLAGILYKSLLDLPGRKFASSGTDQSQSVLSGRGFKIYSTQTMVVLHPLRAALMKHLRVGGYASPCPLQIESLELPNHSTALRPDEITTPLPPDLTNTAYVHRGSSYWESFCRSRDQNGTVALRLTSDKTHLQVLLKVLEVGQFRWAILLGVCWPDEGNVSATAGGKLLRVLLEHINVSALSAGEADPEMSALLRGVSSWKLTRRSAKIHWWVLPKADDQFHHDDVSWWLTLADRDSFWGIRYPDATPRWRQDRKVAA